MSEREEVLDEFTRTVEHCEFASDDVLDERAMADEIAALRSQLAEMEQGWQRTYDHDVRLLKERAETAERERNEARRERDSFEQMAKAWKDHADSVVAELVALRHRVERAEAVVEAAKVYEQLHVKLIAEGASERYPSRVFDDLCIELDVAANNLCAALRALDATSES